MIKIVKVNISTRKCKTKTSDEHKPLHNATIWLCIRGMEHGGTRGRLLNRGRYCSPPLQLARALYEFSTIFNDDCLNSLS